MESYLEKIKNSIVDNICLYDRGLFDEAENLNDVADILMVDIKKILYNEVIKKLYENRYEPDKLLILIEIMNKQES